MWKRLALYKDDNEIHTDSGAGILRSSRKIQSPTGSNGDSDSSQSTRSSTAGEGRWAKFNDLAIENFRPIDVLFKNMNLAKTVKCSPINHNETALPNQQAKLKKVMSVAQEYSLSSYQSDSIDSNGSSSQSTSSWGEGSSYTGSGSGKSASIKSGMLNLTKRENSENSIHLDFKPVVVFSDISISPTSSESESSCDMFVTSRSESDSETSNHLRPFLNPSRNDISFGSSVVDASTCRVNTGSAKKKQRVFLKRGFIHRVGITRRPQIQRSNFLTNLLKAKARDRVHRKRPSLLMKHPSEIKPSASTLTSASASDEYYQSAYSQRGPMHNLVRPSRKMQSTSSIMPKK